MPRIKGAGGLYGLTEEGNVASCDGKNCNGTHITHVQGKAEANKKGEALRVVYELKFSETENRGPDRNLAADRSASIELTLLKTQLAEALKKINEIEQNLNDLDKKVGDNTSCNKRDTFELEERIELIEAQCQIQNPKYIFPITEAPPKVTELLPDGEEVTLRTSDGLDLKAWWVEPAAGVASRNQAVYLASFPSIQPGTAGVFPGTVFQGVNRGARAPFAQELADKGFHVLLMDYRGCGGNPGEVGTNSRLDNFAAYEAMREFGFKNIVRCEGCNSIVTVDGKFSEEYQVAQPKVFENESGQDFAYSVAFPTVRDAASIVKFADTVAAATEVGTFTVETEVGTMKVITARVAQDQEP